MRHHRSFTSTRVAHADCATAGSVAKREKRGNNDKKGVESHRAEGRQTAVRSGGWWRLGLN